MKFIFTLFVILLFSACTTVQLKPADKADSTLPSKITLTDAHQIKSAGFVLDNGHVTITADGKQASIPHSDIAKIETIDRATSAKKMAKMGLVAGGAFGVYALAETLKNDPDLTILVLPAIAVSVVGIMLISGATGYVLGDRVYYELNPLDIRRQTEYSSQLLLNEKSQSQKREQRGIHLGLNFGTANVFLPKIAQNIEGLGQSRNAWSFLAKGELGGWVNEKLVIDASFLSVSNYDEDGNYAASRDMTLLGLQATYFPRRKGFYYKGGLAYGGYFELVEDITTLNSNGFGKIRYEKNDKATGINAALGYATPIYGHVKLTSELSGQVFILADNKPIGLVAGTVGLHWY